MHVNDLTYEERFEIVSTVIKYADNLLSADVDPDATRDITFDLIRVMEKINARLVKERNDADRAAGGLPPEG